MSRRIVSGFVICGVCQKRIKGYTKYNRYSGELIPPIAGHLRAWEHGQHRAPGYSYTLFCTGSNKDFPREAKP